ncbi:MAG: cryptochrome/photolyase family protein [Leptospiraceae bacterium]|nr:cryptochrome/photolyase family protein [Leptospiraceae bacterium]
MELCTYYKFHKHKLILFLASMRKYAESLKEKGFKVHYENLEKSFQSYEWRLLEFLKQNQISRVFLFEIEDKFFEKRILNIFTQNSL